jgi:hypothetical protein
VQFELPTPAGKLPEPPERVCDSGKWHVCLRPRPDTTMTKLKTGSGLTGIAPTAMPATKSFAEARILRRASGAADRMAKAIVSSVMASQPPSVMASCHADHAHHHRAAVPTAFAHVLHGRLTPR